MAIIAERTNHIVDWQNPDGSVVTATIHPDARHLIGKHVHLGEGCVIRRAVRISDHAFIGVDAHIGEDTSIGTHTSIGAGSQIGAHVSVGNHTVIGVRVCVSYGCHIGNQTLIEADALISQKVSIGDSVRIDTRTAVGMHSMIGHHVNVYANGGNTIIGRYVVLMDCVDVHGGAIIKDRTLIQGDSRVFSDVTVGDGCMIGRYCVIAGDLPVGTFVKNGDRVASGAKAIKKELINS